VKQNIDGSVSSSYTVLKEHVSHLLQNLCMLKVCRSSQMKMRKCSKFNTLVMSSPRKGSILNQ